MNCLNSRLVFNQN